MCDESSCCKQISHDLWAGRALDHIPVHLHVNAPTPYAIQERCHEADKQLKAAVDSAMATWNTVSTTDAMPAVHYWAHDREQTPWVEKIITDLGAEVWDLPDSDPPADGWIPEGLRLIRMFAEAGRG